jgi:hypothetical protein
VQCTGSFHVPATAQSIDQTPNGSTERLDRLEILQSLIDANIAAREELHATKKRADPSELAELQVRAIDVDLLGEIDTTFGWRNEVTQILQPIVENLKALTEKPRTISKLKTLIELSSDQQAIMESALESIEAKRATANKPTTQKALDNLTKTWQRRQSDAAQALVIAQLQLAYLQNSNVKWWETVRDALREFFQGRGLTLLLVLMAVISVFYVRGDLLLMGLSILAAAAIALGLRQTVPRFITEARLLLNLGSIREDERVIYNGLPWQVVSLNMHSVLRNPELTGIIRLPLSEMTSMISQPAGKEPWFPASRGDFIILENNRLMELVRLTPEIVEIKDGGGTLTTVPTTEFFGWTFRNLSRSTSFGIHSTFGNDYQHQHISLTEVPSRFKQAIEHALKSTAHADAVNDVLVEFKSAGPSSLDFLIYVTLDSRAAKAYAKLERLIQQTCVAVCTDQHWGIPFHHLTIQPLTPSSASLLDASLSEPR